MPQGETKCICMPFTTVLRQRNHCQTWIDTSESHLCPPSRRESGSLSRPRVSSASETMRMHVLNRARRRPSGGTQPVADMLSIAEQGEQGHMTLGYALLASGISA